MAWKTQKLDEERELERSEVIAVRMNKTELLQLEELKTDLGTYNNSTALKVAARVGQNVLQSVFGRDLLHLLFKKNGKKL